MPRRTVCFLGRFADLEDVSAPALGAFDPLLHRWASRDLFVGAHSSVETSNAIFRPTALVAGRIVATWRLGRDGLVIRQLQPIAKAHLSALAKDALALQHFLALEPSPAQLVRGAPG